ncbi:RHS repeat-associated core domain-containing protein [soil metagenome]
MMPAAKHGDPQMGVDIHLCMVPAPAPVPTPLPTPHMSVVFDPMDYVPFIGATITVCGMKRATAGTNGTVVHIPPGFPFAPKLPEKDDELFMGSATIVADGDPMSHIAHPVLSCQMAGMMSPFRVKKKGGPKAMVLPTVFNLAIPSTVFLGGPPTINLMGMIAKAGFSALGKLAKSGLFKKMRQKLFGHMKPGFLKCVILRAEPVNILNGEVSVEQQDFVLPGRLPIEWDRVYGSSNHHEGLCGHGWETPADGRLEVSAEGVLMQYPGVGPLYFAHLPTLPGDPGTVLELMDGARLTDHGHEYRVRTKADRIYHFAKHLAVVGRDVGDGGVQDAVQEIPLARVSDLCGNWLEFERSGGRLVAIVESAGRRLEVGIDRGRIRHLALWEPAAQFRHVYITYEYGDSIVAGADVGPGEGDLTAVIDALGNPYRFAYDAHHMVRHTDRNGLSFYYEYDKTPPDDWRVVHAWGDGGLYDYRFDYLDAIDERRITDSLGHVSLVKLDERGLPISEIDALGGITLYEYDDAGRTTAVVDPEGRRTGYVYDERGNLLELQRPDGAVIATEYNLFDKPTVISDPNGANWVQHWDERCLLVDQISPMGNVGRYEYDGSGCLAAFVNPRGARTGLTFDPHGSIARLTDALGHTTLFAHDPCGNLIAQSDALDRQTRFRYDVKGRLIAIQSPSGSIVQCDYDFEDNLTRYIDENGHETRFEYAGLGMISRHLQPDGLVTNYRYDTEERLIAVRNQRGEIYELRRDPLGRVVREIDYWGQQRLYAYDGSGHMLASEDALGRRIEYAVDPLGRVIAKSMPGAADLPGPRVETLAYDANGNLTAAANEHVVVSRTFDAESQLLEEIQSHRSGRTFVVESAYDAAGNRIRRVTGGSGGPDNVVEYAYDLLDQSIGVEINGGSPMRMRRNGVGQVNSEELFPGLNRLSQYDSDGELVRQDIAHKGRSLFSTRYEYDPTGNLTHRRDSESGDDRYVYDPMGHVLEHLDARGRLRRFVDDPAGDVLATRVVASGQVATLISSDSQGWCREGTYRGTTYRFDRVGNLFEKSDEFQATTLEWDSEQRLVASRSTREAEVRTTRYGYDPLGRRIFKETGGVTQWFGWDEEVVVAESEADANRSEYVYSPESSEPLAYIGKGSLGDVQKTFCFVVDPNGSPTRLLDDDGVIVWGAHYDVHGRATESATSTVRPSLRLLGQQEDVETGLCYNRHRYFDPAIGAFISQDPIGLTGGINPYEFGPNVFAWVDPLGLTCWSTARKNFWKKQAKLKKGKYSARNLARMKLGKAPRLRAQVLKNGKKITKDVSMELHHAGIPQRVGGPGVHAASNLKALTPWKHEAVDAFRNTGETLIKIVKGVDSW